MIRVNLTPNTPLWHALTSVVKDAQTDIRIKDKKSEREYLFKIDWTETETGEKVQCIECYRVVKNVSTAIVKHQ